MLIGRLAKPNTNPTERTTHKAYHCRLPERGATAETNAEHWTQRIIRVAVDARISGLPLDYITLSAQAVNV
jgi:hypothetical protein